MYWYHLAFWARALTQQGKLSGIDSILHELGTELWVCELWPTDSGAYIWVATSYSMFSGLQLQLGVRASIALLLWPLCLDGIRLLFLVIQLGEVMRPPRFHSFPANSYSKSLSLFFFFKSLSSFPSVFPLALFYLFYLFASLLLILWDIVGNQSFFFSWPQECFLRGCCVTWIIFLMIYELSSPEPC